MDLEAKRIQLHAEIGEKMLLLNFGEETVKVMKYMKVPDLEDMLAEVQTT